jgi:hypothetical protein
MIIRKEERIINHRLIITPQEMYIDININFKTSFGYSLITYVIPPNELIRNDLD